jgi:hypothetical protein
MQAQKIGSGMGGRVWEYSWVMRSFVWILAWMGAAWVPLQGEEAVVVLKSLVESRSSEATGGELRLWVRMQASGLQDALEYQEVRIEQARDDTGRDLAPVVKEDAVPVPSRLTRGEEEGVPWVMFPVVLQPAARQARMIPEVRGTVTLRVFRKQVVLLENVRERMGKSAEDPLFKAHGLEVFITDPVQGVPGITEKSEMERLRERAVAVRISGEVVRAMEVDLVDAAGVPLPSRVSSFGSGRSVLFTLVADRPLPAGVQARLTIPASPREAVVPFTLKNIVLP